MKVKQPNKHIVRSSGNVFADLKLRQPEDLMAKAMLAQQIGQIIVKRNLTQAAAAEIVATTQAKVSDLVRGKLDGFTLDRLIKMLLALDYDVRLSCIPKARGHKYAALEVRV